MEIINDKEEGISEAAATLVPGPLISNYIKMMKNILDSDSSITGLEVNGNEFSVSVDVQQFRPEEIKVSVDDNYLVVEGKHEERSDPHGFISRQFKRRYNLPKDVDKTAIVSQLSSDGVLTLKAPHNFQLVESQMREVPIIQTHVPAMKSKRKDSI